MWHCVCVVQAAEKEVQKREELKKKKKEGKAQRKRDKPQSDKPHPQQQQGGQGSKRKRVKPSHVFYDDSDEETEPIKRPKGVCVCYIQSCII